MQGPPQPRPHSWLRFNHKLPVEQANGPPEPVVNIVRDATKNCAVYDSRQRSDCSRKGLSREWRDGSWSCVWSINCLSSPGKPARSLGQRLKPRRVSHTDRNPVGVKKQTMFQPCGIATGQSSAGTASTRLEIALSVHYLTRSAGYLSRSIFQ